MRRRASARRTLPPGARSSMPNRSNSRVWWRPSGACSRPTNRCSDHASARSRPGHLRRRFAQQRQTDKQSFGAGGGPSTTSRENRCAQRTLRTIIRCALVCELCAMKVIVVGGGIGGLTTALMLHARGLDCEGFEQSDVIRELGVGINRLPHAIKELAELGLLDRLDAVGLRTYELFYTNCFGQEIWRELRGTDAGYEVPQFSIHRGRLQAVIYQAVRARLGESRIHTG